MEDTKVAAAVAAVSGQATASPAPTTPAQAPADPRMDAYIKKERALAKMRKDIEAEKLQLQKRATEYETGYIPKSRLTADPLSVLNESGVSYDQLTELLLSQGNASDPATKAIMSKLKALEDKQSAVERQTQEAEQRQYTQAIGQIRNEVKLEVASNTEFETIKAEGMEDAVVELIEETFNTEGYIMNIKDAAQEIENYLVDYGYKLAQTRKVQERLKPKAPEVPGAQKPSQNQLTTLSQNMPANPVKRLGDKERIARAMAAFKGELK